MAEIGICDFLNIRKWKISEILKLDNFEVRE